MPTLEIDYKNVLLARENVKWVGVENLVTVVEGYANPSSLIIICKDLADTIPDTTLKKLDFQSPHF